MDAFVTRTKPAGTRREKSVAKPKPYDKSTNVLPIHGGVKAAVRLALSKTDNAASHSESYSRTEHVQSSASGHQTGGMARGGSWHARRLSKLRAQAPQKTTDIFKGVIGHISGYTGAVTSLELTKMVQLHGGEMRLTPGGSVTHTFTTTGLSGSKHQAYLSKERVRTKIVSPEWVLKSIANGKRLDEARFAVVFNEVQKTIHSIYAPGGIDIRKRHATTYESPADVPVHHSGTITRRLPVPKPQDVAPSDTVGTASSPLGDGAPVWGDVGAEGGGAEHELDLDEWGMPPSGQRQR